MNRKLTNGTKLEGVKVFVNDVHEDNRGHLVEQYSKRKISDLEFVQDNLVFSVKNTLRGLHFQKAHPQGKLITVVSGYIYDVCVDLRKDSLTYGKWFSILLSDDRYCTQVYIPEGFAHGFIALTDCHVLYKCTDFYYPDDQYGYVWNDKNRCIYKGHGNRLKL